MHSNGKMQKFMQICMRLDEKYIFEGSVIALLIFYTYIWH